MSKRYGVGMVGNPNCGKTTLFNALTGSRQRVGNWPGVTVERKVGRFTLGDLEIELIDLPGTYSLEVTDEAISADEAASLVVPQPLSWLSQQDGGGETDDAFNLLARIGEGLATIPVRFDGRAGAFAFVAATLFCQVAPIAQHPATSIAWMVGLLLFVTVVIALL